MSISPLFGIGNGGIDIGTSLSGYYVNDDFSIGAGCAFGSYYNAWNANMNIGDFSISHGVGYYRDNVFRGNTIGAQIVGTYGFGYRNSSVTMSNDLSFFSHSKDRIVDDAGNESRNSFDRWKSSAVELSINRFPIGTYVLNNWGRVDSGGRTIESRNRRFGAWANGQTYISPLWLGYSYGKVNYRMGYSIRNIQQLTQNVVHRTIGRAPDSLNYDAFYTGLYFYVGNNNTFTLWGY